MPDTVKKYEFELSLPSVVVLDLSLNRSGFLTRFVLSFILSLGVSVLIISLLLAGPYIFTYHWSPWGGDFDL